MALVNPLSQHKEQAVAYLEAVLQEMPPEERLLLWPNLAQPVERDGYQEEYAALQDELDRLNALPDEERLISEIQSAISLTEDEMEGLKRYYRWALSEEDIAAYHSFSDNGVYPYGYTGKLAGRRYQRLTAAIYGRTY